MKLSIIFAVLILAGCSEPERPKCNCNTAEYTSLDGTTVYGYNIPVDCETGQPEDKINMGGYFTRCLD